MQLMPATARREAKVLQLTYSRKLLTEPEANVRMGTSYLAQKIQEFGGMHLALASYNAGESAVRRWIAERPSIEDAEEFVEDIPYNETRTYVKRILGTAEDYRRLYGS
jgi:soluble lytic murein transglycosylase